MTACCTVDHHHLTTLSTTKSTRTNFGWRNVFNASQIEKGSTLKLVERTRNVVCVGESKFSILEA